MYFKIHQFCCNTSTSQTTGRRINEEKCFIVNNSINEDGTLHKALPSGEEHNGSSHIGWI